MKKTIYLLLILVLLFSLFSACSDNQTVEEISSGEISISSSSISEASSFTLSSSSEMHSSSTSENSSDFTLFADFSMSTIKDDELENELFRFIKIFGSYSESSATNYVYAKDYFDENSTNYTMLTDDDIVFKYSGDYIEEPSNDVLYINYLTDTRYTPKEEWIEFFNSEIYNDVGDFQSPIIIRESWTVNTADMEIEIVICNNFIYNNPYNVNYESVVNVPLENSVVYNKVAVFINGDMFKMYSQAAAVSNLPYNPNDGVYASFLPATDEDILFRLSDWSYQYDENKNIIQSPIFSYHSFRITAFLSEFLIFDVDKDSFPEIIHQTDATNSLYSASFILDYDKDTQTFNQIPFPF